MFTTKESVYPFSYRLNLAFEATADVRAMADINNIPYPGTVLEDIVKEEGQTSADCTNFTTAFIYVLKERNIEVGIRILGIGFMANYYDMHSLVELYNEDQQRWMLLDPTFSLTVKRLSDGLWATAEDVSLATLNKNFGSLSYIFLDNNDSFVRYYYIDYPLLYLNIYHVGTPIVIGEGNSSLPYLEEFSLPLNEQDYDLYVLRNESGADIDIMIDGVETIVDVGGLDLVSKIFSAKTISLPLSDGTGVHAYRLKRYVFQ